MIAKRAWLWNLEGLRLDFIVFGVHLERLLLSLLGHRLSEVHLHVRELAFDDFFLQLERLVFRLIWRRQYDVVLCNLDLIFDRCLR